MSEPQCSAVLGPLHPVHGSTVSAHGLAHTSCRGCTRMPSVGFYTPCPCRQCSWAQGLPCSHLSPACARLGTLIFPQTQDSPPVLPLPAMGGTTFPKNLLATCVPFSGQSPCPDPPPTETFLLLLLGLSCVPSPTQPLVPLHPRSLRVVCPGPPSPRGCQSGLSDQALSTLSSEFFRGSPGLAR